MRISLLILLVSGFLPLRAQSCEYTLGWENPTNHLYSISLRTEPTAGEVTDFQIPAWRPGRYIIQRYAGAVSGFRATDDKGNVLTCHKTDRDTWQVSNPVEGKITIQYDFYAFEMDAGSSYLTTKMAYFNGANLFMHVRDRLDVPCTLKLPDLPADWRKATALKEISHGMYSATDYHELVDAPSVLSPSLKQIKMQVDNATFWIHFQGNFIGDQKTEDTLKANLSKIIREQTAVFGEMPLTEYHFIIHLLPYNMRHAVEHSFSSCYTLPETVTKDSKTIAGMYGIISHEFWHLWNVKRIRPAAMWPYDYQKEVYTRLQWFTEGVTDYYTDLILERAGVIKQEDYFKNLSTALTNLENSFATTQISPAMASFDSWLSGSDYVDPNRQASYYALGKRVGLLLDLELRIRSEGAVTMDHVFRHLYENYYKLGKGVPENGIQSAVETLTQSNWQSFFDQYVSGTGPVDYDHFFSPFGIKWQTTPNADALWTKIGVERLEKATGMIIVSLVNPAGEAAKAGLSNGDYILMVNGKDNTKFDEKVFFAGLEDHDEVELKILREGEALTIKFDHLSRNGPVIGKIAVSENLSKDKQALLTGWLQSNVK
jgi:predicted metalloprotease with PDZ domain